MIGRIVIQYHCTDILHAAVLGTGYPEHIFPTDRPDFLQDAYHPVYCCGTDIAVYPGSLIKDFLTAGAVILQNNINSGQTLFRYPAAPLSELFHNHISLHL